MDEHRVLFHEPICPEPDCGSFDITESDIDTAAGFSETVLQCRKCGAVWPVACVVEWSGHATA